MLQRGFEFGTKSVLTILLCDNKISIVLVGRSAAKPSDVIVCNYACPVRSHMQ